MFTATYAILELSPSAYEEIERALSAAGYCTSPLRIDGIELQRKANPITMEHIRSFYPQELHPYKPGCEEGKCWVRGDYKEPSGG